MDFYDLKNAFLVGVFMAFMIGPVFFMLIKTSILKGARAAIIFDIGVILADVVFILFAYYGSQWGPQGIIIGWGFGGALFGVLALLTVVRVLRKLPDQAKREGIQVQVPAIANSPFSSGRNAGL